MASALWPIWAGARAVAAEVDALDERVDGGRGGAAGHGDRRVVAAAEANPRPAGGQPLPNPRKQLELAHRPIVAPNR